MKFSRLLFAATALLAVPLARANDLPPVNPAPGSGSPAPAPVTPAAADSALPASGGYAADRYAILWTKSPFAVATSESVGEESPDYFLVGVANQDGVFYASVVERQNQEHFLLSSDKPVRGLTLKSIDRTRDGQSTFAEVMRNGQPLTLKLEQAPSGATGVPTLPNMGMAPGAPGAMTPQIPMPGGVSSFPGGAPTRPFIRFHRPAIHLPPNPGAQAPVAPSAQTPNPPPPPPPAPQ